MTVPKNTDITIPVERVEQRIFVIRGQKVILDSDLATLYGVTTARLNEQVKRNKERFPVDFMFQLCKEEFGNLKSQFATSSSMWGGRRKLPYAFTEHGAIMAASVLNSQRAIHVSVYVVRAFVRLRQVLATHKELAQKLEELEQKLQTHDKRIRALIFTIRELMHPAESSPKTPIGYQSELEPHQKQVKKAKARPKEVR
jgi:hypothetical protein